MTNNGLGKRAETKPAFAFEGLPLEDWEDTKTTLHLFCQIVGKIRLGAHPKLNHWWHVPLYVSARGLTTRAIPYGGTEFEIAFDFIEHNLIVNTADGTEKKLALNGLSVAGFYAALVKALADMQISVPIIARPYEHKSTIPFAEDQQPRSYDPEFVERYWRILVQVDSVFKEFSGLFLGKQTPPHLFWHSFDLALTRFSGRQAPPMPGGTPSDREAYSHEVISFGFWPGDDTVREPAFYSYTYPEPEGLSDTVLQPDTATWVSQNGSSMALLMYDDLRATEDPKETLLQFLESTYQAGARRADWPIMELTHEAGTHTDKSSA